jgi:pimeloyl-ACP methyl ester carboxylesterase
VILAEYPAYGPRAGKLGEAALVSDAVETIALAHQQFQGDLLIAGESLGAGVAAAALRQSSTDITGLMLITPWDTLENVGRHHYPWAPVKWLLRDRYDTVKNLNGFRGRVAVVLAEQDSIVPAHFGKALFDSLSARKSLWTIPGADHNEWMSSVDNEWWRSAIGFLSENQCGNR